MSKIVIEVKTARLYRDTDTWSKMDPYVVLMCGGEKKKSKTHNGGGKNPIWNQSLTLKYVDTNMTVQVWDKDTTSDDFVGGGAIDLSAAAVSGGLKDWVSIQYKGKDAGQVYLEISFTTDKAAAMPTYAPATAPATSYYAAPAPAPAYAPPGYAPTAPGVYAPAPAPAPAYPTAAYAAPGYAAPAPGYAAPAPAPTYAPAPVPGYAPAPAPGYAPAPAPGYAPAPAPAYAPPATPGATYAPAPAPAPGYAPPGSYPPGYGHQ